MHPALSVIFFTTMSGAGYGLAFVLATGHGNLELLATKIGWFIALALIGLGLLSSTLHLGNPQRAWRAFSQWRSSWLSREGVMAVLTFVPLTILAFQVIFLDSFSLQIGMIAAVMSLITVFCTAMIYASLRTVAAWHTILTPLSYLGFSLSSGSLIYLGFFGPGRDHPAYDGWLILAVIFLLIAWAIKGLWILRSRKVAYGGSSMETATGLGDIGKVRLLERPHVTGNYLTSEMGFRVARKHEYILTQLALLLGLTAPVAFLLMGIFVPFEMPGLIGFAALCHLAGLFVERWLFFATARHAVSLYYGDDDGLKPSE